MTDNNNYQLYHGIFDALTKFYSDALDVEMFNQDQKDTLCAILHGHLDDYREKHGVYGGGNWPDAPAKIDLHLADTIPIERVLSDTKLNLIIGGAK